MLKFQIGHTAEQLIGLIFEPFDFMRLRQKDDNGISIDCGQLGRPDVRILMMYFRSSIRARKWAKERLQKNLPNADGLIAFNGERYDQKVIGVILTEPTLVRFEQKGLAGQRLLDDPRFGVPGLKVMLTYCDSQRQIVRFLREFGMTTEQFSTDPNLRPLWENHRDEVVADAKKMANYVGRGADLEGPVKYRYGVAPKGVTEAAILATRGTDMAYFAAHPHETEYYRRAVPGEIPTEVKAEWVKVIKVPDTESPNGESVRIKIPMNRINGEFVEATGTRDD